MTDNKRAGPAGKPIDQETAQHSLPKISRRRFTKAGAVAPLVMTLGSRPVWGTTCSFSGQLSGNDYSTAAPMGGVGHLPSHYWDSDNQDLKNLPDGIKFDEPPKSTKIADVVQQVDSSVNYGLFGELKFDVLSGIGLDAHAAAAVLNIAGGNYGYEMHGLIGFLEAAGGHPEAVEVLICLNSRG